MVDIKAKMIAFNGVMVAISTVLLYAASTLPTLKLAVCLIASGVICIAMMKYGVKSAALVYAATSILSIAVSPNKILPLCYFLVFGNYPIVKSYIEGLNRLTIEWAVKLILFALYIVVAFVVLATIFPGTLLFPYSKYVLFVGGVVVVIIYDIALSLFISELYKRLKI